MNKTIEKIKQIINSTNNILIIQADNPDGDSLGSALALEQILGDMGKTPYLYCGVEIPSYIKYMKGWDRVSKDIPNNIDASVIVDTSASLLLKQLESSVAKPWIAAKPVIIIDHHENVKCDISFADVIYNPPDFASTGEVIYEIANLNSWKMNVEALEFITQSILSDTLGLTSETATANTYRHIADMIEAGVNRAKLEEQRRALSKMPISVFRYKAQLIERTEFYGDENEIAITCIPEEELFTVGTLYNPAPLILNEITMTESVKVGIALKRYRDKITGAIRCSDGYGIAHELAENFGGGGHAYAAGFKIEKSNLDFAEIKSQVITKSLELLKG